MPDMLEYPRFINILILYKSIGMTKERKIETDRREAIWATENSGRMKNENFSLIKHTHLTIFGECKKAPKLTSLSIAFSSQLLKRVF
jgi:hypothetical protein